MKTQKEFTRETQLRLFTIANDEYLSEYNSALLEKVLFDQDYYMDDFFEDEDTVVHQPYEYNEGDAQEAIWTLYTYLCQELRELTAPDYKLYED
jgi:hypothetical protein